MHPTKHQVNFLYENEIVEKIQTAFEAKLVGSNDTRELYTQQLLPGASNPLLAYDSQPSEGKETKVYAKDMVRSDSKEQKLEKFFGQTFKKESPTVSQSTVASNESVAENDTEANSINRTSLNFPIRISLDIERKYTQFSVKFQLIFFIMCRHLF